MTGALDVALPTLACPLCGRPLDRIGSALRCADRHTFDIARQGYASLTIGGGPHLQGDTAAMVAARERFLAAEHYAPIAEAVAAASPDAGWCVELAGGTGYYSARVLNAAAGMRGVTIDVSKAAAKSAARAHPRLASITGDVHAALPIRTGAVALVLCVFGPRRADEIARILAPDGSLVVVTPQASHLAELRGRFSLLAIGADKDARLEASLAPLELIGRTRLEFVARLSRQDVVDAILMGPNAFHRDTSEIERLATAAPDEQPATVAVTISRYRAARGTSR